MTPTEQFRDREEAGHAMSERIDQERPFRDHYGTGDYEKRHARVTRYMARRRAAINIRLVREEKETTGNS